MSHSETGADHMIRFLFPRLTPRILRGQALFDAVVAEARQPHWYVAGGIADCIDGRFAVLATLAALTTVRLERGGEVAQLGSVGLAERFVEAMDGEHRQMGISDPTLGKTVRKLVGALGRRVELWRDGIEEADWHAAVAASLYRGQAPSGAAATHCEQALRNLWARLAGASDEALVNGRIA